MEIESIKKKTIELISKYKYAALILVIGLALMLIPGKKETQKVVQQQQKESVADRSVEEDLKIILSKIEGAGEVDVMLSKGKGERITYQTDSDISKSENANNETRKTVTVTSADKNEEGLIVQIEPAVYLGAVVVSQGANKPSVKLALVDAVSKVTGLGANQITVLKMK